MTVKIKKPLLKHCAFLLMLLALAQIAGAQDPFVNFSVIPPSPQAGALGRFVDVPVSYFTGTPEISIPLYQVTGREVSVPISLDYNARGIRVQDVATYAGLGWSLNAGGTITKSVRGKRDDGSYESYVLPMIADGAIDGTQTDEYLLSNNLAEGSHDSEPDHFSFNFCGYTGKFFMVNNEAYLMPQKDIRVENTSGSFNNPAWKITTADGAQYFFEEPEMTYTHTGGQLETLESAWHLTRIISGNLLDTITFTYTPYALKHPVTVMETRKYDYDYNNMVPVSTYFSNTYAEVRSKVPSTIRYKDITVTFVPGQSRLDVDASSAFTDPAEKSLGGMQVTNGNTTVIRKVELQHTYFGNTSGSYQEKRLRLDKVVIDDDEPYSFTYTDNIPSLTSKGQDHWGFYNGTNPLTMLPAVGDLPGSNREATATHSLCGMIDKVTYPTGGYTDYDFEVHSLTTTQPTYGIVENVNLSASFSQNLQSSNFVLQANLNNGTPTAQVKMNVTVFIPEGSPINGLANAKVELYRDGESVPVKTFKANTDGIFNYLLTPGTYYVKVMATAIDSYASVSITQQVNTGSQQVMKYVGGARVKKITSYDPVANKTSTQRFLYVSDETTGESSGTLFVTPNYVYTRGEYIEMGTTIPCMYEPHTFLYHCSVSNTYFGGTHIGYSKVTVYDGDNNGKIVYYYASSGGIAMFDGPVYGPGTDHSWQQGLLTHKVVFNAQGDTLQKQVINYTSKPEANIYFNAVKVQYKELHPCSNFNQPGPANYPRSWDFAWYYCISQFQYIDKMTTTEYVNNLAAYSEKVLNDYANMSHKQLTHRTMVNNLGEQEITVFKYPADYPGSYTMGQLMSRHMLNILVEKKQLTNGKINHALLYRYASFHNKYWFPYEVYDLDNDQPVTDFTIADPDSPPVGYVKKRTLDYNVSGDLNSDIDGGGSRRTYIWSRTNPTGDVLNAAPNQVAYTSFERGETGNWTFASAFSSVAKTGLRSYASVAPVQSQILPPGQYIITGYARKTDPAGANGTVNMNGTSQNVQSDEWTALQWQTSLNAPASVTVTLSANVLLDELRLYPADAVMKTYTAESGIGVTSATDANNQSTHYEYKAGRLSVVRDNQRNILNQYHYHYKGN